MEEEKNGLGREEIGERGGGQLHLKNYYCQGGYNFHL